MRTSTLTSSSGWRKNAKQPHWPHRLLRELGAPDRLLRHAQLAGEAADALIPEYEARQPPFDRTIIGVAVHDANKILHRALAQCQPGMLLARQILRAPHLLDQPTGPPVSIHSDR